MQLSRLLVLLSALTLATFAAPTQKAHELVARLPKSPQLWSALNAKNVDIFGATSSSFDVRVTQDQLNAIIKANNIDASSVKILIKDLDKQIAEERQRLLSHQPEEGTTRTFADWHSEYHTYEDIKSFTRNLAQANPTLAKFTPSIGKSWEGRDIFLIKITGTGGNYATKKRVWIHSMQHAREWISGATTQYLAENLLSAYKAGDARVVKLLDQVEFVITPVANPDGYVHTWRPGGRMWRKNRAKFDGKVYGVDMNRNWENKWEGVGSSADRNSETFRGPSPGSEPEVKALEKEFLATPNVWASLDMHSYSEVIMRPWAYLEDDAIKSPAEAEFLEISNKFISAVQSVKGPTYGAITRLYPVAGGARDWGYDVGKAYSMTIELSPDSESDIGFILPPTEIKRVGNEMWNGILTFAETAISLPKPKMA